jgi:SAM-dependent methyltransferase
MAERIESDQYDPAFFEALRQGSHQSATVILPIVFNWIRPTSVVDVGCGDGTWLSVAQALGVRDILGLDGDYVQSETLQIPSHQFQPWDLSDAIALPRTFDLALCLEVAEHLSADCADGFIASLVGLSDVILFSAAIPHQGGTHHVNEQWPDYWIQRFQHHDYRVLDVLRDRLWAHPAVQPWYAQNTMLCVRSDRLATYPGLQSVAQTSPAPKALVHPAIYLTHCPAPEEPAVAEPAAIASPAMEIVTVTLSADSIPTGAALTLTLHYRMTTPLASARVSLSISNAAGQCCLDTDTLVTPLPMDLTQVHTLDLHIDRLDLVQGCYFVNPGLFSPDWTESYDFQWHRYSFQVHWDHPQKGMLHPPMAWSTSHCVQPSC